MPGTRARVQQTYPCYRIHSYPLPCLADNAVWRQVERELDEAVAARGGPTVADAPKLPPPRRVLPPAAPTFAALKQQQQQQQQQQKVGGARPTTVAAAAAARVASSSAPTVAPRTGGGGGGASGSAGAGAGAGAGGPKGATAPSSSSAAAAATARGVRAAETAIADFSGAGCLFDLTLPQQTTSTYSTAMCCAVWICRLSSPEPCCCALSILCVCPSLQAAGMYLRTWHLLGFASCNCWPGLCSGNSTISSSVPMLLLPLLPIAKVRSRPHNPLLRPVNVSFTCATRLELLSTVVL